MIGWKALGICGCHIAAAAAAAVAV